MKTVTVRWEITEEHSTTVEVDDDFDIDDLDDTDQFLADHENNDSWRATTERTLLEITENDSTDETTSGAYDPHGGEKHRYYEEN